MNKWAYRSMALLCGLLLPWAASSSAAPLRVSVASNFAGTMRDLVSDYTLQSGMPVQLIIGSSGKLYAQIGQGAPFDLFFSADAERPAALEAAQLIVPGSRTSYAYGELVLWPASDSPAQQLETFNYRRFAIANPRLAPYGRAASAVLDRLSVLSNTETTLVMGENIAQTYQFISSGNADAGLVARSQMTPEDHFWPIPSDWYPPIEQQAVILRASRKIDEAKKFMTFIKSDAARAKITAAGYRQAGAN